jgi:hypothetical protein
MRSAGIHREFPKVNAMFEASVNLMAGGTAISVVERYREHVAANAKRLSH